MGSPTVSIIIPCYNTAKFVRETLASVFGQTRDDFEVIVINDGSPDTEALERALEPYRERIVYIVQDNRGVASARNAGIRAARGEYVALLDSDDIWEPEYLSAQLAVFERDPTVDVLSPDAVVFGDSLHSGRRFLEMSPTHDEVTFERLVTQEASVRVFVMARRDVMLRAGLFDESLRSSEDYDLWLRILKHGGRITHNREVLARYRKHPASLSADPIWMCNHILQVLDKATQTLALTPSEHAVVVRERGRWVATLRLHEGKKRFFSGDSQGAWERLAEANTFFRQWKLTLAIGLLRVAPRLLFHVYEARDRVLFRRSTRY